MTDSDHTAERQSGDKRRRKAIRKVGPPIEATAPAPIFEVTSSAVEEAPLDLRKAGSATSAAAPAGSGSVHTVVADTATIEAATADAAPIEHVALEADRPPARPWLVPVLAAVAAAVLVVLAAGVAFLSIANNRAEDRADAAAADRDSYVEAAKTTVLNLTTIHADTAKEDVDKILDNASGEFLDDFEGRIEPFVSIVREAKVDTDGEILAAGVESQSDGEAVVLVASKAMVKNAGTVEAQPRNFRMRITITDVDGRLTTSKVEFVP